MCRVHVPDTDRWKSMGGGDDASKLCETVLRKLLLFMASVVSSRSVSDSLVPNFNRVGPMLDIEESGTASRGLAAFTGTVRGLVELINGLPTSDPNLNRPPPLELIGMKLLAPVAVTMTRHNSDDTQQ